MRYKGYTFPLTQTASGSIRPRLYRLGIGNIRNTAGKNINHRRNDAVPQDHDRWS